MNPLLQRYNDAAEARDFRRVTEYQNLLAVRGFPEKLATAVPQAEKLLAAAQKLAGRLSRDFPLAGNANRPGRLQELIADLHAHYVQPILGGRFNTLPQRMREFSDRIQAAKPLDFKFYSPETLARVDINRGDSFLGELRWLEECEERVSAVEGLIREWLASPWGGQASSTPPPAPESVSTTRSGEDVTLSDFDPRR